MSSSGKLKPRFVAIAASAALLGAVSASAHAADFYNEKVVKLVVGSGAGGGYDFFGRALAKYLGKYIPGNPTVIVVNMPGAGGVKMTNWAYSVAPKDGTMVGMPLMTVAVNQHLRPKKIRYDATKLNWIGNMESSISILFTWETSKTKTIQDAMKRETLMGGSSKSSPIYQLLTLSNKLLGTKFKIVLGYKGAGRFLAIERGEVEGSFSTLQNLHAGAPHWYAGGKNPTTVLVQNAVTRSPEIPNIPTMMELAKNDADRKVFEYMMLQSLTGRSIFAPPSVPGDRVAALRHAMNQAVTDPGFVRDMKRAKLAITYSKGEKVEATVNKLINTPPAIVARIRQLIK
jgi:tripartite-type tricarboxylate transporter receptor subunit TctC